MKKLNLFLATLLTGSICLGGFTACGGDGFVDEQGNKVSDPAKVVEIALYNSGAGRVWLDDLIKAYQEKNPGYAFSVVESGSTDTFYNTIESGARANSFDLYFTYGPRFRQYFDGPKKGDYLENLNDVYSAKVDGDDKSIADKIPDSMKSTLQVNGNYYAGYWQASACGLLYNKAEFDAHSSWKQDTATGLPNTTDQLASFSMAIYEDGKTPYTHFPAYTEFLWAVWWEQYQGEGSYKSFWSKDYYEYFNAMNNGTWNTNADYVHKGVNKALETLYSIVTPEGYTMKGSNTLTMSEVQTKFVQGDAMMMVNGGWLETELAKNPTGVQVKGTQIQFMKAPVISSIVETLEDTSMMDEELSAIIDWIDGGKTGEKPDASDNDIARIEYARNVAYTTGPEMFTFVPSYAEGKGAAKEFLKFMYSNEGAEIYLKATKYLPPWYVGNADAINTSDWTPFAKSHLQLQRSVNYIFKAFEHPVNYMTNHVGVFYNNPEEMFTLSDGAETVSSFFAREISQTQKDWEILCAGAGLD